MSGGHLWVVGATGLLGSHVQARADGDGVRTTAAVVPWEDGPASARALVDGLHGFLLRAGEEPWSVAWCAGAGVPSSGREELERELVPQRALADALAGLEPAQRSRGALFFASSAGAVYAGSAPPPFTELSQARPLGPYGDVKLSSERIWQDVAASGLPVLIARISNIYGPGQNLAKAQGLISQLCLAHLTGNPIHLYVSLDTVRDYLFVDDAAGMILDGLDLVRTLPPAGRAVVKIVAAQRSATIAQLLGEFRRVFKRSPRAILAASPAARVQSRDLRFRSVVAPELDRRSLTTLAAGIRETADHLALLVQRDGLAPTTR